MVHIYPGAIHIHTTCSDGTGTVPEVIEAAKKAGLSWIVITDHNNMDAKEYEGFHDGLIVVVGEEISPETSDHYISLGTNEAIGCNMKPAEYVNKTTHLGGFGFIAHPDEKVERKNSYPALRWTDWSLEGVERGFGGVEIWNYMSDWVDYYDATSVVKTIEGFAFKNHALRGPTKKTLAWWDELNLDNPDMVPAIAGVDVHALHHKVGPMTLEIFPYKSLFKTLTNLLHFEDELSGDFQEAKACILNALKLGHNLMINRIWNKRVDMPIVCVEDDKQRVYSGGQIELNDYTKLLVKLPQKAELRIIYDGQLVWQYETDNLEFDKLDRGKYRIEAYYNGKPWIFSNPILITDSSIVED